MLLWNLIEIVETLIYFKRNLIVCSKVIKYSFKSSFLSILGPVTTRTSHSRWYYIKYNDLYIFFGPKSYDPKIF